MSTSAQAIPAQAIPASVERGQVMPSSVIRNTTYDEETQAMHVTFVSGRVYVYERVPRVIYHAFRNAPSRGAFFNVAIRGRYHFHELAQEKNRSAR
jgi:hypothetical protein